jgi:hypothetical protein
MRDRRGESLFDLRDCIDDARCQWIVNPVAPGATN